jgi:hypothetical protein
LSGSEYAPPSGSQLSIEDKADLWDRLMSCERIRVLGYARGGADGKQGPINHIGLELWATFAPAKSVELNTGIGRDLLTEFARGVENNSITGGEAVP